MEKCKEALETEAIQARLHELSVTPTVLDRAGVDWAHLRRINALPGNVFYGNE